MGECQQMAHAVGANAFVFNYRGVSRSRGTLSKCSDLVSDAALCFTYLTHSLHASPANVLLFGRSLGGGVATLLRARYPGPIANDRSFRSMAAAAQSVLALITSELLKKPLVIPLAIVRGVAASFLPLDLEVTDAWCALSGPKLILFHLEDKMIAYDNASLHQVCAGGGMSRDNTRTPCRLSANGQSSSGESRSASRDPTSAMPTTRRSRFACKLATTAHLMFWPHRSSRSTPCSLPAASPCCRVSCAMLRRPASNAHAYILLLLLL